MLLLYSNKKNAALFKMNYTHWKCLP